MLTQARAWPNDAAEASIYEPKICIFAPICGGGMREKLNIPNVGRKGWLSGCETTTKIFTSGPHVTEYFLAGFRMSLKHKDMFS